MKRVVLHVGPHKTGSSYLQKKFFESAERLRNFRVCYPINHWIYMNGHHNLVDHDLLSEVASVVQEIFSTDGGVDTVLLSTENFDRLSFESIAALKEQLNYQVSVVFFLRKPNDLLYAAWQEDIKHGSDETLSYFLLRHLAMPFASPIVNPSLILDLWADIFGIDNIQILDYDSCVKNGDNIFTQFLEGVLGITDFGGVTNEIENKSLSIESAELLRAINSIDRSMGHDPGEVMRAQFLSVVDQSATCDQLRKQISVSLQTLRLGAFNISKSIREEFCRKYQRSFLGDISSLDSYAFDIPKCSWIGSAGAFEACKELQITLRGMAESGR